MKTPRSWRGTLGILAVASVAFPRAAGATPFTFSTGNPDGLMAATFTGLIPPVQGGSAPAFDSAFSLDGQTVATVPEPTTLLLLGSGMVLVGWFHRRGYKRP